jgi:two-component system response regulator VicR
MVIQMNDIHDCTILVVDGAPELLALVEGILRQAGYHAVFTAPDCRRARQQFARRRPDAVILDVVLPDGDGFALLQELRAHGDTPVLFLSARDEDENRLLGLGLGADDYITKPFLPRELILRLGAVLRRTYFPAVAQAERRPTFTIGEAQIDLNAGTVSTPAGLQMLTAKEYALLLKLYENRGNIVTLDSLCRAAWGDGLYGYENTLMVHIRRLRTKIEADPSHPRYLLTVRGLGYKLVREEPA